MKKIQLYTIILLLAGSLFTYTVNGQGWTQNRSAIYSVGVGGTDIIALNTVYPAFYGGGTSLNFSGEFKVQRFIGIGFQTGIDVLFGPPYTRPDEPPYAHYAAIGIPIGLKANVHILEAANVPVADRLDVYAGLNLGGGPAFYTAPPVPGGAVYGFIYGGPQIGVRYWLSPAIAIFGEFGWGATYANIGFTF